MIQLTLIEKLVMTEKISRKVYMPRLYCNQFADGVLIEKNLRAQSHMLADWVETVRRHTGSLAFFLLCWFNHG
jgi:hypothetical protein